MRVAARVRQVMPGWTVATARSRAAPGVLRAKAITVITAVMARRALRGLTCVSNCHATTRMTGSAFELMAVREGTRAKPDDLVRGGNPKVVWFTAPMALNRGVQAWQVNRAKLAVRVR